MLTPEPNYERALGIRPSVCAVIFDRRGRLLLQQLVTTCDVRDACVRRVAPFVR